MHISIHRAGNPWPPLRRGSICWLSLWQSGQLFTYPIFPVFLVNVDSLHFSSSLEITCSQVIEALVNRTGIRSDVCSFQGRPLKCPRWLSFSSSPEMSIKNSLWHSGGQGRMQEPIWLHGVKEQRASVLLRNFNWMTDTHRFSKLFRRWTLRFLCTLSDFTGVITVHGHFWFRDQKCRIPNYF